MEDNEPAIPPKRRGPEAEIQVAAAAITAAISPPLGIAVAAGSALRSQRVRSKLRQGTVSVVADAMQLSERLRSAADARARTSENEPPASAGG